MNQLSTINNLDIIRGQVIPDWVAEMELDLKKPPTIKSYQQGLDLFINWLSDQDISSMKPSDIKQFRNDLAKSYSGKSVNLFLTGVRSFFAYCVTENLLPSNPAREVSSIGIDESFTRRALTTQEVRDLLASCEDDLRAKAIITLMLYCGLRRVEIHRLNMGDVELSKGRLQLHILGKGRNNKEWVNVPLAHVDTIINWLEYRKQFNSSKALFISFSDYRTPGH